MDAQDINGLFLIEKKNGQARPLSLSPTQDFLPSVDRRSSTL
jgi:hypothetical protein